MSFPFPVKPIGGELIYLLETVSVEHTNPHALENCTKKSPTTVFNRNQAFRSNKKSSDKLNLFTVLFVGTLVSAFVFTYFTNPYMQSYYKDLPIALFQQ